MNMKISDEQAESVLALSGPDRYRYFIKVVADWEEVWGLYHEVGWALAATDTDECVFPIWPARKYAELCAQGVWSGYSAASFTLSDFMEELLPNLRNDNVLPGIFYTPTNKGVTPPVERVLLDLYEELQRY